MYEIPDEFSNIPEAVRLRQAVAEFKAAIDEAANLTRSTTQRVHLVYKDPLFSRVRSAQESLKKVQADFDAATGEPKPVGLTPHVFDEISKLFPAEQHQQVIDLLDQQCGRKLPGRREATAIELERTRISALRLSRGNLAGLHKMIELANIGERDLLYAAADLMGDFHV